MPSLCRQPNVHHALSANTLQSEEQRHPRCACCALPENFQRRVRLHEKHAGRRALQAPTSTRHRFRVSFALRASIRPADQAVSVAARANTRHRKATTPRATAWSAARASIHRRRAPPTLPSVKTVVLASICPQRATMPRATAWSAARANIHQRRAPPTLAPAKLVGMASILQRRAAVLRETACRVAWASIRHPPGPRNALAACRASICRQRAPPTLPPAKLVGLASILQRLAAVRRATVGRARWAGMRQPRDRRPAPSAPLANFPTAQARALPPRVLHATRGLIRYRRGRIRATRASSVRQEATLTAWDRQAACFASAASS